MKYLALALVACTAIVCDLIANMELDAKASAEWDRASGWIILVVLFLAIFAHYDDRDGKR